MQELTDAFNRSHPCLGMVCVILLIVSTIGCAILCWKDRKSFFSASISTGSPLRLTLPDYYIVTVFIVLIFLGLAGPMTDLLLAIIALIIWKLRTRSVHTYLHLTARGVFKVLGLGLMIALGVYLPLELLSDTIEKVLQSFGRPPSVQEAVKLFLQAKTPGEVIPLLGLAILAAPIAEEFFFRGVIYPAAKCIVSPNYAMLLSSFLFAALHRNLPSLIPLMLLGMLLCRVFERTGSLWTGILIHATFNAVSAIFIFVARFYS